MTQKTIKQPETLGLAQALRRLHLIIHQTLLSVLNGPSTRHDTEDNQRPERVSM